MEYRGKQQVAELRWLDISTFSAAGPLHLLRWPAFIGGVAARGGAAQEMKKSRR
jgi:hypothetical protein